MLTLIVKANLTVITRYMKVITARSYFQFSMHLKYCFSKHILEGMCYINSEINI